MTLIAICARNLCSAKIMQTMMFDVHSTLLRSPIIQMAGDVFSFERRAREGTDAVCWSSRVCSVALERGIKQIWPEYALGGGEQLLGQWSLAPAHHLGIEPRGLRGIGTRSAV